MDLEQFLLDISGSEPQTDRQGFRINCCFHNDTTYDLAVSTDERYYCFSCGASGSSFSQLVSRLYGIPEFSTDRECALDILFEYEEGTIGNRTHSREIDTNLRKIHQDQLEALYQQNLVAAKEYYNGNFSGDALANKNYDKITPGYSYAYRRGLLPETLKHFRIIDWQRFPAHPILVPYTYNGNCWGYEQRRISSREFPKVLSMVGTRKQENVHGFVPAGATFALVMEGPYDQALSWQYGWRNQAQFSILGSHVYPQQAKLMASWDIDYYISAFDMDMAGRRAHESFTKAMFDYNKIILQMDTGCNGLSFIPKSCFVRNLDVCLSDIELDHTAVLVPTNDFS